MEVDRSHGRCQVPVVPVALHSLLVLDSLLLLIRIPLHLQVFLLNSSPCNPCIGLRITTWNTNRRNGFIQCKLLMAWAMHPMLPDPLLKALLTPAFPYRLEPNLRHFLPALRLWLMLFHTLRTPLNLHRHTRINHQLA